jgi:hypothetical protein
MINMNVITFKANTGMSISTIKFDSLTYSKKGLVLHYRNKPKIEIPFADLNQIYIKKHKLHFIVEIIGISFPFLFVIMSVQYLPFDLMILVSIISILAVCMFIINLKWYRLYVRLNDGTTFKKKISLDLKTENISILEKVRTEYTYYNLRTLT